MILNRFSAVPLDELRKDRRYPLSSAGRELLREQGVTIKGSGNATITKVTDQVERRFVEVGVRTDMGDERFTFRARQQGDTWVVRELDTDPN